MTKKTIRLGNPEGRPSKMSRIRKEMRQFFSGLSGEEKAMFEGEISGRDLGLFEGFFYGNDQGVSYALKQLNIKYHGKFDEVANRLRNFLATVECVDLSKRALFLNELQNYAAEEPKTEELVREERTQVQVIVDGASPMDETAPIPTQPQNPNIVGFTKAKEGREMTDSPWAEKTSVKPAVGPDPDLTQPVYDRAGAAFSRKRRQGDKLTIPKFVSDIGPELLKAATEFFDEHIKTEEDEKVLKAVLKIVNPNNLKEMQRLIRENARPGKEDAFMQMNNNIVIFIDGLGRPEDEEKVRKALMIRLKVGHILPDVVSQEKGQ